MAQVAEQPEFLFNRGWSAPGVPQSEDQLIAQVAAWPTWRDLLTIANHYGVARVQRQVEAMYAAGELSGRHYCWVAEQLEDIRIGFEYADSAGHNTPCT